MLFFSKTLHCCLCLGQCFRNGDALIPRGESPIDLDFPPKVAANTLARTCVGT